MCEHFVVDYEIAKVQRGTKLVHDILFQARLQVFNFASSSENTRSLRPGNNGLLREQSVEWILRFSKHKGLAVDIDRWLFP